MSRERGPDPQPQEPDPPSRSKDQQSGPVGEPRWLTSEERAAWLAVVGMIARLPAALDAQLRREAGISLFEYMVMAVLSEQPDWSMQMSQIARDASASLSRLSHNARRLEQQGYLERTRCPGPGRRTNATLTQAGYEKVAQAAPGHVAAVRHLLIDLVTSEQLGSVRAVAQAVLAQIDSAHACAGEG